ncbi:C40 family peptidase [Polaribacter gangjinensis]|uniref:Glycoside hydrolase n=1 Tax=Polaribacter gangjinensis TaxID=574710 RepID=A0A2S7WF87_9FLAO|nr:C40 family peptidase [Polaribacter gangjinensis]PQJ76264.1 glycoside hydrolase [Polaribacter gangjinensis]
MSKIYFSLLVILVLLSACSSTQDIYSIKSSSNVKINNVVDFALKHEGVKYRYGGTTNKGMDCSGLVTTSFKEANITLPRSSGDMSKEGKEIPLESVKKGDLVFFAARNRKKNIDHVGLVTENKNGKIQFIHSTTQRGVIISSFSEEYWQRTFVKAVTLF